MSAGPSRPGRVAVRFRSHARALFAGFVLALVPVVVTDATFASIGLASTERRCRMVKVKLKRDGKVVERNGKPVFRRVRRCRSVPSPGCRFVKVKKRKNGKVVKRHGRPVFIKVERCPPKPNPHGPGPSPQPGPAPGPGPSPGPGPAPQPGPADDLANRVLAMAQHVPGEIDLFTSIFVRGDVEDDGLYPAGSAMAPAAGPAPTEDEVRAQLTTYLNRWFAGDSARVNEALALFDDDDVKALIADPTLRAAFAAMKGTPLEPTMDHLLTSGKFVEVRYGAIPQLFVAISSGPEGDRRVLVNSRYDRERFEYLIGIMGHEFMHDDSSVNGAEEAILNTLSGMTYMQVLSKTPELAHGGTELARQFNDLALVFTNSREAGSPNSEIYAPTGLGVAPGSPRDAPDFWTVLNGGGSSAGSAPLRTILQTVFSPGTSIPATLNFDQATAELFENLNDDWLSDVDRAQLSVLLELITVDEIADATGLGQQQIIDTLGLQPYLDAIQ